MSKAAGGNARRDESLQQFIDAVRSAPWGSLAKSELEFQVFRLLVAQGDIDLSGKTDTALAAELEITPARVRALRFKWEQRERKNLQVKDMFAQVIPHALTQEGDELILRVDSTFVLDRLVDELRAEPHPVLVSTLRTPGHVQVDVIDFWVKAVQLCKNSNTPDEALLEKLEEAFPQRSLKKAAKQQKEFITKAAGLAGIAEFLNSAIRSGA